MPAIRPAAIPAMILAVMLLTGCADQAVTAVSAVVPDTTAASPSTSASASPTPASAPSTLPSQATTTPDAGSSAGDTPSQTTTDANPAAPTTVQPCAGDLIDIRVERRPTASGAGQTYSEIIFTNTGSATCTLEGPPAVLNFLDASTGGKVGMRGSDQPITDVVTLASGQAGYALIHFSSTGAHDCPAVSTANARISPPQWDLSRSVTLDYPVSLCTDRSNYDVSGVSATPLEG